MTVDLDYMSGRRLVFSATRCHRRRADASRHCKKWNETLMSQGKARKALWIAWPARIIYNELTTNDAFVWITRPSNQSREKRSLQKQRETTTDFKHTCTFQMKTVSIELRKENWYFWGFRSEIRCQYTSAFWLQFEVIIAFYCTLGDEYFEN